MAALQQINGIDHLRFRLGGKPFRRSLGTVNNDEAETIKKGVEVHLSRINVGVITPPPDDADVVQYDLTGGKNVAKPKIVEPASPTLEEMWHGYLESLPVGSKEKNSFATATTHFTHLLRILKPTTRVSDLSTDDLQRYINARSKQKVQRGGVKAGPSGRRSAASETSGTTLPWSEESSPKISGRRSGSSIIRRSMNALHSKLGSRSSGRSNGAA